MAKYHTRNQSLARKAVKTAAGIAGGLWLLDKALIPVEPYMKEAMQRSIIKKEGWNKRQARKNMVIFNEDRVLRGIPD